MNISSEELSLEKKYLEKTKNVIKSLIDEKSAGIQESKELSYASKRFLWEHLNEYSETEMYSTMDEEDLHVSIVNDSILKVSKLYRSLESPYFGRIDFETQKSESLYFGLTEVRKDDKNYVYDWRSPIANLYYNFEIGPASFVTPDGTVNGKITKRRQFKIEMGKLIECFDNNMNIDDEMLQEVLLSNSDEHMRNIVNTIQKEQNEVIRYAGKDDLIIEGIAGSGKTSVAMHRIAYLLYRESDLTSNNILIFSPNNMFTEYISTVLPELGEENVLTTTFEGFAKSFIKRTKIESLTEFIERSYEKSNNDELVCYKLSSKYKKLMDEYLQEYIDNLSFSKKIGLKKLFITSDELNEYLHSKTKRLSLANRINYIAEKLCDKFEIDEDKNAGKMALVIRKMLKIEDDPINIYKGFISSNQYKSLSKEEVDLEKIHYEDIFGILYLYFEIIGYPIVSKIKYVVIDEAQDYSLLQYELLQKIFKGAIFTLLGDRNQIINPYVKYNSLDDLKEVFKNSKYKVLDKTYRSSAEIIDYTNKILGLNNIKSIRNYSGNEVIEKKEKDLVSDIKGDIEYFKKLGLKRFAIITKTKEETDRLSGLFEDLVEHKKLLIIPSYLSKGLEFDGIIAYSSIDNPYSENEKNLFYVVTTRAQHSLIVYNQK